MNGQGLEVGRRRDEPQPEGEAEYQRLLTLVRSPVLRSGAWARARMQQLTGR
ncbi:hypothetical protein OOK13_44180 [Streptomyces sp. NBC_00378]|uniref:hypothetical protein n=1 Tax=unclassified Streptomyces TaxID=2593676 RepID=UPI002251D011|nr:MULTISPECIES: hypothetical protein [unclassified Streptomyces]MCX5115314.1 hypothetical protein [Streptomyces sp. NBC_00378]